MRKTFKLEDLDCANCAAKMEEAIKKLPGVKRVSVNFMTQKMILDA
ncbi:MAG: cation transporter, partial [Lachnospiraceae bacterium]|nr:cation transporter [Lachnospiraceae bacterium]